MKILIVDDDQYIRELYVEILTDEKFDVDSAEDGIEGIDKIIDTNIIRCSKLLNEWLIDIQ